MTLTLTSTNAIPDPVASTFTEVGTDFVCVEERIQFISDVGKERFTLDEDKSRKDKGWFTQRKTGINCR